MAETRSDEELVRRARAGSPEAFGALVARYKDAVFGAAYHRLQDFEEARDVTQEAFVKAFQSLAKLRRPSAFANWLYHIAEGTAIDAARRRREELPLEAAGELEAAGARHPDGVAEEVRDALATLPEATRLAVILHYVDGYSHAEVAGFLGATEGAVKTRVSRGKARLRKEMAEMVEDRLKRESCLFLFEAEDDDGRGLAGEITATSAAAVRRLLGKKGYHVKSLKRDTRTPQERLAEEREAISRVAHVILEQGLKDKAAEIRIELPRRTGGDEPMRVWYLIGDARHEVMTMPTYVWEPLRLKLAEMADLTPASLLRRRRGVIRFPHESETYVLVATFNRRSIRIDLKT